MMMFMIIIIMTNFVSRRNSSTFNRTSIETMCVSRTWLMNIHDMHRRRRKTPRRQQLQNRICNCNIEYVCNDDMIHTIIVISCWEQTTSTRNSDNVQSSEVLQTQRATRYDIRCTQTLATKSRVWVLIMTALGRFYPAVTETCPNNVYWVLSAASAWNKKYIWSSYRTAFACQVSPWGVL